MQKQETSISGWVTVKVIIMFAVIGVIVTICITFLHGGCNPKLVPFKKHLDEYTAVPDSTIVSGVYIRGKIITIDKKKNKVDLLYLDLPEERRATQPEEVGTIVWLEWGEEKVGTYTDGSNGYAYTCQVTIIDKTLQAKIGHSEGFRGSYPTPVKTDAGDRYGSKPTDKIIDYLTGLPRK